MRFENGHKMGSGRPRGAPNKATSAAREAIARFVDGNVERLQGWLDEIAKENGSKAAWDCVMDVLEYHVPKLQRTELTGKDGEELKWPAMNVIVNGSVPPPEAIPSFNKPSE
jgi:hypothetical protein